MQLYRQICLRRLCYDNCMNTDKESNSKRKSRATGRPRGGRRPGAGRPLNVDNAKLTITVDPRDGIKDELNAVSKQLNGVSISDIALSVMMFSRGRYASIAERMRMQPLANLGTVPEDAPQEAPTKNQAVAAEA